MPAPRPLILTRPREQSDAFAAVLADRLPGRFRPVIAPLLAIAPLARVAVDVGDAQALLFSSANGVAAFAAASPERGLPAICVGDMTAAAARSAGFAAVHSADGDVHALARLAARLYRPGAGALVHIRGRHAAGDLVGGLAGLGLPARGIALYDQVPVPLSPEARQLLAGGPAVVAIFSPRTGRFFAAEAAGLDLALATVVALSPAALGTLRPGRAIIAAEPTREAMLAALAEV